LLGWLFVTRGRPPRAKQPPNPTRSVPPPTQLPPPPPQKTTPGRWEFWRRAAKDGVRSFDQPLHVGLAFLLVAGVMAFDAAHNVVWRTRNKGVRLRWMEWIACRVVAGCLVYLHV
jgi:hypothetical protein